MGWLITVRAVSLIMRPTSHSRFQMATTIAHSPWIRGEMIPNRQPIPTKSRMTTMAMYGPMRRIFVTPPILFKTSSERMPHFSQASSLILSAGRAEMWRATTLFLGAERLRMLFFRNTSKPPPGLQMRRRRSFSQWSLDANAIAEPGPAERGQIRWFSVMLLRWTLRPKGFAARLF